MILELKRRNEKSLLLHTTKKNISDELLKKLLVKYLELKGDDIKNYNDEMIKSTLKSMKSSYVIKWDSIDFKVYGDKTKDYIKLKSKYGGAILQNDDYILIYD